MQKNLKHYSTIGNIHWPIHDPGFHDLAYIMPERAGVMTVRLLVEDTTTDRSIPVIPGMNARDDFMVGVDKQPDTALAHKYFSGDEVKIVENILLGASDWCGVKRISGTINVVEYFRCEYRHLGPEARKRYDQLMAVPGVQLWLVTSINTQKESVNSLMAEVERNKLPLITVPKVPITPVFCRACETQDVITVKPHISSKRLGWKRLKKDFWLCPKHNQLTLNQVSEMEAAAATPPKDEQH